MKEGDWGGGSGRTNSHWPFLTWLHKLYCLAPPLRCFALFGCLYVLRKSMRPGIIVPNQSCKELVSLPTYFSHHLAEEEQSHSLLSRGLPSPYFYRLGQEAWGRGSSLRMQLQWPNLLCSSLETQCFSVCLCASRDTGWDLETSLVLTAEAGLRTELTVPYHERAAAGKLFSIPQGTGWVPP